MNHNNLDQNIIEYDQAIAIHQAADREVFEATNEYNRINDLLLIASKRLEAAHSTSKQAIANLGVLTAKRNLADTIQYTSTKIDGKLHSINDQPAVIDADGNQWWYINGILHRDNDKPAIICADGRQFWYVNGEKHRDNDRPAVIYTDGTQFWYINGKLHRNNDLPATIFANGTQ